MKLMVKTSLGKKSLMFLGGFFVFLAITSLLSFLLQEKQGDYYVLDDRYDWIIAVSSITGLASGATSYVLAILALIKQQERALLIALPLVVGTLLSIFLVGELFLEH